MGARPWSGELVRPGTEEPKKRVCFWAKTTQMAGSLATAVILDTILYWWRDKGDSKFYKFIHPCSHPLYKEGESWSEVTGLSRARLRTAINEVSVWVSEDDDKNELLRENLVVRYQDGNKTMWWELNTELLGDIWEAHQSDEDTPTGIDNLIEYVRGHGEPPEPQEPVTEESSADTDLSEEEVKDMLRGDIHPKDDPLSHHYES